MMELLAVVAIIGVLVGLLLPAIQASREGARRMSCASNLGQIGLAVVGYHNAFDHLPVQLSGTDGSTVVGNDNDRRLSVFVALLPFLSQGVVPEMISQPIKKSSLDNAVGTESFYMMDINKDGSSGGESDADPTKAEYWVAGGPEPFNKNYRPWRMGPPALRCPSDPGYGHPAIRRTNYAVCLGDGIVGMSTGPMKDVNGRFVLDQAKKNEIDVSMRGSFKPREVTRFGDIEDGLSQTIMMAEIATGLGDHAIQTEPAVASLMPSPNSLQDTPTLALRHHSIDPERRNFWDTAMPTGSVSADQSARRGYRWADGMPLFTACNTILPPNREIILSLDQEDSDGVLPPSSRHTSGVQVCLADGAVRFVNDSIDAGRSDSKTVYPGSYAVPNPESPFGVWGAMGTRASSELASESSEEL